MIYDLVEPSNHQSRQASHPFLSIFDLLFTSSCDAASTPRMLPTTTRIDRAWMTTLKGKRRLEQLHTCFWHTNYANGAKLVNKTWHTDMQLMPFI